MLRILYAGSPAASAKVLEFLLQNQGGKYEVVGVLTNPPSSKGRHKALVPTDVAALARNWAASGKAEIPVLEPEHLLAPERAQISALNADLLACFAYGHIFGPKFLGLFPLGGINLHPSLLPKFRGATPVQAAILAGETETGITVQKLALEPDTGDILRQMKFPLDGTETAGFLLDKSADLGAKALHSVIVSAAEEGRLPPSFPQEGEPSECTVIRKEDGRIDWSQDSAQIHARLRAFSPWPGAFTELGGSILKVLEAFPAESASDTRPGTVLSCDRQNGVQVRTGDGALRLLRLQWQGKNPVEWKEFANGARNFLGAVLGD